MSKRKQSGGIGFLGLLAIAFIVLKLCHVIDWSWWWVLSPILFPMTLAVIGLLILLGVRIQAARKYSKNNQTK